MEKVCVKCGQLKPIDQFYGKFSAKDGHEKSCKDCSTITLKKQERLNQSLSLTEKECSKCGEVKPIDQFEKRKDLASGRGGVCKLCRTGRYPKEYMQKYHADNRVLKPKVIKVCIHCGSEYETHQGRKSKYCSDKCSRDYNKAPFVRIYKTKEEKRAVVKAWKAKWIEEHREQYNKQRSEARQRYKIKHGIHPCTVWKKNRINKGDVAFRLSEQIRKRIHLTLIGKQKYARSLELLGCTAEYARQHIENQFTEGMTWDNWAMDGWHIDHIKPVASFDLMDEDQQRQCFHYTNLQPLWAKDNFAKSDKIIERQLICM